MSDILEKIKKLQVLAERGLDGERENAEKMVEILMKKHGISTVDLEEEKENYYLFAYNGKTERQLLIQVMIKVLGRDSKMYKTRHTRQKLGVYCTPAQKLELELEYDFYKRKFNEDMELFLEAFIQRNKIFPVDVLKAPIDKELTAKEMQMLWIAEVLERHERKCLLE